MASDNRRKLYPDFEGRFENARQMMRDHPGLTLAGLLRVYPARFGEPPTAADLASPVSNLLVQPVSCPGGIRLGGDAGQLRLDLDRLWQAEQAGEVLAASPPHQPTVTPVAGNPPVTQRLKEADLGSFPATISDHEAVRAAYRDELDAIADYLKHGLSVLVVCDKILTEFIYEFVCNKAGKLIALDSADPPAAPGGERRAPARSLQQAIQGPAEPLPGLSARLRSLKPEEILVLRALELLDIPPMIELVYQRTSAGHKPQLLAFLDPSLEVKKVLTDRFAVHVGLLGLPRHVEIDGPRRDTVSRLITQTERACFLDYDPEGLYKNVSGLNAVQFRNAMQFVGAKLVEPTAATNIYRLIRQFKKSSSDEIEIPVTTFEDIGGYEQVKQDLRRIVRLLAGSVAGLDEGQRGHLIPRGFIFHGPPGTGKTLFAKWIANEMNATIQMISGPEIMDKYVGQSESNLRRIFATARRNAPSVIFFDEFDSIASQRSSYSDGGTRANNAVVAQLLTELDGFREDQAVLVIGTSNRIDIIDEALLRPSRLRPIKIALPDFTARQRVAEIHARTFHVDALLRDLCELAGQHLGAWEASAGEDKERQVPADFLDGLWQHHAIYRDRYAMETGRAGFLRELGQFFTFLNELRTQADSSTAEALVAQVSQKVQAIGQHYGLDLHADVLPDLEAEESRVWLLPMQSDIRDLFTLLHQERQKHGRLTPDSFLAAIMNLVAEYTEDFNNDEIRAIFQEASLEHHMEGQLVTPRYLGLKIGLIRKRRDEREAVHLSRERGRR